jgi:hypothetical protein
MNLLPETDLIISCYQYYYLDIPLPPSASAQTHPQGGIPSTSMQLQFCNVAFLIAAYYDNFLKVVKSLSCTNNMIRLHHLPWPLGRGWQEVMLALAERLAGILLMFDRYMQPDYWSLAN